MKRIILTAAIAVLLTALQSSATVLLYESFGSYTNGALPGQSFQGTGFEAAGSWDGYESTVTNADGLSYSSLIVSGGKMTTLGNDGSRAEALPDMSVGGTFDNAGLVEFPGTSSNMIGGGAIEGTLYYSFLARSRSTGFADKFAFLTTYRGGAGGTGGGTRVLSVGNAWAYTDYSAYRLDGYNAMKNNYGAGSSLECDTSAHLFVVRVSYSNGTDGVKVWMDPDLGSSESGQGASVYMSEAPMSGDASFDNFRPRSGNSQNQWEYDEIRFGTTWGDVLPIPEPAMALVTLCGFAALLRRK